MNNYKNLSQLLSITFRTTINIVNSYIGPFFDMDTDYGFIVPCCIRNDLHLAQLKRCLSSIKEFHPDSHIILIDDSDEKYDLKTCLAINLVDIKVEILKSFKKGSADQQVPWVFVNHAPFNKLVYIQDSMLINKPLNLQLQDLQDCPRFLLYFTNHRVHWDIIQEQELAVNHTGLIRYYLLKDYSENKEFLQYALNSLERKDKWVGAFGNMCIATKEMFIYMDSRVKFLDKFMEYTSNRQRRVNESIFSLICHYCYPEVDFSKSLDGLYYDGFTVNSFSGTDTGFDNLTWCYKGEYLSKVSFNR
jgi:hypothetical protein